MGKDRIHMEIRDHNAWNLKEDRIQLFANRNDPPPGMMKITARSMAACSALPFIIQTVEIDGVPYCEGALFRTVSFTDLIKDHPDLEEVWVLRIVDPAQVRPPKNLDQAMNNLCMLFAGSLGESNVHDFVEHAANPANGGKKIEIHTVPVPHDLTFDWNHSNLDRGIKLGYEKTLAMVKEYLANKGGQEG